MSRNHAKRRRAKQRKRHASKPGAAPGTITVDPAAPRPLVRMMAYGPDELVDVKLESLEAIPVELGRHAVVWVNVDGLGDAAVIKRLGEIFGLHPLALEDVVHTHQRPKVEQYGEHLFVVLREARLNDRLETEQFSLFLGKNFVLSFGEREGDAFDPIRERLRLKTGRGRGRGADFLAYALLDATIDSYFPILETYGDRLEDVEDCMVDSPDRGNLGRLHEIKRDLLMIRRALWPTREAIAQLSRDEHPLISADTRVWLRDCYDHTVQLIDLAETDREVCADLMDLYVSGVSNRLNSVMKVLTIISTIFIPLTFLAGVYGMNFHTDKGNMPELLWKHGYLMFWIVCGAITLGLLGLFWKLGWLTDRKPKAAD